jgi:hypothetical protein
MVLMTKVYWKNTVEKQLDCIPDIIIRKFRLWVALVEESGICNVRKHKGFHKENILVWKDWKNAWVN